jgi:DMSO/TMAO reductase YedYZ heme-binding membrane subunit
MTTYLKSLLGNIRFYILIFSTILAASIFIWAKTTIQIDTAQATTVERLYALLSIIYLYIALLATPLTKLFPSFPYRGQYIKARRAIGFSAFSFAFLHSCFAFFGELGGFPGLGYLNGKYLFAIAISAVALLILTLMASTSFDWVVEKLTFRKWKLLHRFVYLVGLLTLVHLLLLGSDFTEFSGYIPQLFFAALVVLLSLEMYRFDKYLKTKLPNWPSFGLSFTLLLLFIGSGAALIYGPSGSGASSPFNIHAAHIQLAKQAQSGQINNQLNSQALTNPGLIGDRTRRYTVSFNSPQNTQPNQDVNLAFQVFDASSGNKVGLYQRVYEKPAHLIVVDNELNYFSHIHPDQTDSGFTISTQFPHPGRYHLYLDFQPLGAIEQQFGFTLDVGAVTTPAVATYKEDSSFSKVFGKYHVILSFTPPLNSDQLSVGGQKLSFQLMDSSTHLPITTLKPYLASFGHLVMINNQTYEYIHVHPTNIVAPAPNANGGPDVDFLPLGLYGPIKPGTYRIFAQFNPDNNLFTADFTVKVEP